MLLVVGDGRKVALDPNSSSGSRSRPQSLPSSPTRSPASTTRTPTDASATPPHRVVCSCHPGPRHPTSRRRADVPAQLRALLVQRGIPADRIRFVHEAKTDKARAAMFAQAREGGISVLFGSTSKVGMGTNIQTRLVALHHVDAPWTAADVEQREGRILRPGNLNTHVDIYRYVTEGSFDSYVWQGIHRKAASFAKLYAFDSTDRELEDISPVLLSYGEVKALAAGNPLLLDHAKATSDVGRLRLMRSVHLQGVNRARNAAADCDAKIRGRRDEIDALENGLATLDRNPDGQLHELVTAAQALKAGAGRDRPSDTGEVSWSVARTGSSATNCRSRCRRRLQPTNRLRPAEQETSPRHGDDPGFHAAGPRRPDPRGDSRQDHPEPPADSRPRTGENGCPRRRGHCGVRTGGRTGRRDRIPGPHRHTHLTRKPSRSTYRRPRDAETTDPSDGRHDRCRPRPISSRRRTMSTQNQTPPKAATVAETDPAETKTVEDGREAHWFRDMGDRYAAIAVAATNSLAKSANSAEAAKYYGIAARLERGPYPAVPRHPAGDRRRHAHAPRLHPEEQPASTRRGRTRCTYGRRRPSTRSGRSRGIRTLRRTS